MRWGLFVSILLVIIAFFVTYLVYYEFYPGELQNFSELGEFHRGENISIYSEELADEFPDGVLFYPNLRFSDKKIYYFIDEQCSISKADDARHAFEILENETILDFEEGDKKDIIVSCSENVEVPKEGFFVAGEGGPNSIINASNFYVINNGTILLYRENKCANPVVIIHEILHVLGFKHSSNKKSIMYEVSYCDQQLSKDIVDLIDKTYNIPSLPDLMIRDVSAVKSGNKLGFRVEIFNAGLSFSLNFSLLILTDEEFIDEYNFGELEIGSGKILEVSNLRVPRDIKELSFKIDSKNEVFEINEDNNERRLVVLS